MKKKRLSLKDFTVKSASIALKAESMQSLKGGYGQYGYGC